MNEQQAAAIEELKAWVMQKIAFVEEEQHWESGDAAYRILVGQEEAFKSMLKKLESMES